MKRNSAVQAAELQYPDKRSAIQRIFTGLTVGSFLVLAGFTVFAYTSGIRAVPVLTGSMSPAFAPGTLAITAKSPTQTVRVNDVIAFRPPAAFPTPKNRPVMHRVIKLETVDGHLLATTRGDANPAPDPWTLDLDTASIHRVSGQVPFLGRVAGAVMNGNTTISLMSIAGIILISFAFAARPSQRKHSRPFYLPAELEIDVNVDLTVPDLVVTDGDDKPVLPTPTTHEN